MADDRLTAGPYSIGSGHWPGLAKLVEECGEVQQVAAKLMAANGADGHWDGSGLHERLVGELADLEAAITFLLQRNGILRERLVLRQAQKLELYHRWHDENRDGSLNRDARWPDCPEHGRMAWDGGTVRWECDSCSLVVEPAPAGASDG